jgi:hypothetical protein
MVKLTIDDLIDVFSKLNTVPNSSSVELGEQDASSGGESSGGGSSPSPTKWETQYQIKRGAANQIKVTKWRDSHPITRGVANTLF